MQRHEIFELTQDTAFVNQLKYHTKMMMNKSRDKAGYDQLQYRN